MIILKRFLTRAPILALSLAVLSGLTACSPSKMNPSAISPDKQNSLHPGTVYSYDSASVPVISYDAGNSYAIDGSGKMTLSYNHGQTTARAPLTVAKDKQDNVIENYPGVFISADKTAISYGDLDGTTPLLILISDDMGKTWQTTALTLPDIAVYRSLIGFTSKSDGWLVLCNWHAMFNASNYIFKTSDGGKTWTKSDGNQDTVYPTIVTGAAFTTGDTAFICFWYYEKEFEPPIIWSQDGGITWSKLYLKLPAQYDKYSKTALSPVFDGPNGTLPILLSDGGASAHAGTVYFKSTDYGKTWSFYE
jgi:hypothetical protein